MTITREQLHAAPDYSKVPGFFEPDWTASGSEVCEALLSNLRAFEQSRAVPNLERLERTAALVREWFASGAWDAAP
ncbi:MAG: hypothetical protein CTY28_09595 [Hyphomicrobium sp.]|nr:MAG: hypothetical protein CTY28_09595 [Hyphomicrobium sp.]